MIPLECHLPMLPCHRARVSPRGEAVLGSTAAYYPVSGLPLNFAAPNRQPLTANRSRLIFHRRRAGRSSGLPGLLEDGDVDLVFDLLGISMLKTKRRLQWLKCLWAATYTQ